MQKIIILDPGHGMSNRKQGVFDTGAVSGGITEADIVMEWANELREVLLNRGKRVVRTRISHSDSASISERAKIAKDYHGDIMLSLHCNASDGKASGTETFYRGTNYKTKAAKITSAVCGALGTRNRGAKTESESQHSTLAIMSFQPCFLLEIGFIDNASDRAKMIDPDLRLSACNAIAEVLLNA